MFDEHAIRQPHPVQDHHQAMENFRLICGVRGYCGPFINEAFYNAFPDPLWHGYGECVVCCSTCLVDQEEQKRLRAEAAVEEPCDCESSAAPPPAG